MSFYFFRMGQPTFNDISEVYEEKIYPGFDNPFIYFRSYDLECHCQFDLVRFPFDFQQCGINVRETHRQRNRNAENIL